jgi:hypothetical protein
MKLLGHFRVFAGHYQFLLCDYEADPLESLPRWSAKEVEKGYIATHEAAFITSRANLNDVVISVALAKKPPTATECERELSFPLTVSSGKLLVTSLDGYQTRDSVVSVPAGDYLVYVLSYNLGVDALSTGEVKKLGWKRLSNRQRFARTDYEHHRVVLVPGASV